MANIPLRVGKQVEAINERAKTFSQKSPLPHPPQLGRPLYNSIVARPKSMLSSLESVLLPPFHLDAARRTVFHATQPALSVLAASYTSFQAQDSVQDQERVVMQKTEQHT